MLIFAKPTLAESSIREKASKGGRHIHKRRNCTLGFWRHKNLENSFDKSTNQATGTPCGVYIRCIPNISNNYVLWENVRVRQLYISSWGFRRCSFLTYRAIPGPLWREASDRLAPRFFVYVSILICFSHCGSQVILFFTTMETNYGYEAPVVEVIEVEVEKGFATSGEGTTYDGVTPGWQG